MKKISFLLCPDSFKESMRATEACEAMQRGIQAALPDATCILAPLADGGEGTTEALVNATKGTFHTFTVHDSLHRKTNATVGVLCHQHIGVVEAAAANGLHSIPKHLRNPELASSFGTGELICRLLDIGIKEIIIALGGTATNDGGMGLAQALGVIFYDKTGKILPSGAQYLAQIADINVSHMHPKIATTTITIASDVTNVLTGPNGSTYVYGAQKGATPDQLTRLEAGMVHYAEIIHKILGIDIAQIPGSGAAGGLGAGILAFTRARMQSGIELVINYTQLEKKIQLADVIFTGEGSLDHQTAFGKTISGVLKLNANYQKPVYAFAGKIGKIQNLYGLGLTEAVAISPPDLPLEKALALGAHNLEKAVFETIKRWF